MRAARGRRTLDRASWHGGCFSARSSDPSCALTVGCKKRAVSTATYSCRCQAFFLRRACIEACTTRANVRSR